MSNIKLDTVLQAFHNAVLEAQRLTEQQHIEQLDEYFDWPDDVESSPGNGDVNEHFLKAGGRAKTWKVFVPSLRPDAKLGDLDEIQVPLLALIPPSSIKIKNLVVEFEVGLNEIGKNKNKDKVQNNKAGKDAAIGVDLSIGSGGLFGRKPAVAKVHMEFEAGEPPESFLRINDHLIKSIL